MFNINTFYHKYKTKIHTNFTNLQPIRKISIVLLILSIFTASTIVYAQSINRAQ